MKKHSKNTVVVEVQPEDVSPLELLQPGKLNKRNVVRLIRKVDIKKLGLVAGGAAAALSVISLTGRYTFYKGIVSGELKRQLAPVNKKLDELKAQNAELKAEVERLQARQTEEEKESAFQKNPVSSDTGFLIFIRVFRQAVGRLRHFARLHTAQSTAERL